ncbi:MAG: hypothetical protein ABFD46_10140 [Armatimonadota bacterium]
MRNNNDEYMSEEEQPQRQRFSVTIVWSQGKDEMVSPEEIRDIIQESLLDTDRGVTVDVNEVTEPTY